MYIALHACTLRGVNIVYSYTAYTARGIAVNQLYISLEKQD